jgi:lysophosphatidic acid acyltransferase / lysophosphatidylinositol acyltransferase
MSFADAESVAAVADAAAARPQPPPAARSRRASIPALAYLGALHVFILLVNAAVVACAVQILSFVLVRPFSLAAHRRVSVVFNGAFFLCGTFLLERWTGMRLVVYGEEVPPGVATVCTMNHISDVDMLIGVALLARYGPPFPGNAKAIVKSVLGHVPIFGWILRLGEFLFVTRSWEADRVRLLSDLKSLMSYPFPVWFVIWPEGSRFTAAKQANAQEYARKMGYPHLTHVLLPRFKAFTSLLGVVRGSLDEVCDVTLMFDGSVPRADHILTGRSSTVIHAHLGRYKISSMPEGEKELESWLIERWQEKDRRIDAFKKEGSSSLGPPCQSGTFADCNPLPSVARLYALIGAGFALSAAAFWLSYDNKLVLRLLIGGPACALLAAGLLLAVVFRPSSKGLSDLQKKDRALKSKAD